MHVQMHAHPVSDGIPGGIAMVTPAETSSARRVHTTGWEDEEVKKCFRGLNLLLFQYCARSSRRGPATCL